MDDDDYWNNSETKAKAFSFDDDVLSPQEILAIGQKPYSGQKEDDVFGATNIDIKTTLLPITSLVSPKVLDLNMAEHTLQEIRARCELFALHHKVRLFYVCKKLTNLDVEPYYLACFDAPQGHALLRPNNPAPDLEEWIYILQAQSGKDLKQDTRVEVLETVPMTLKRLLLGRSCSLHVHRSLRSKTELLDGALAINDGNAILTVVLFLITTLNKKLVYELLSSRPVALNHFIAFLHNEGKVTELTDLLTMLGRSPEAALYQYQHVVRSQGSVDNLLRKMSNLSSNHFSQGDAHHSKMLQDYIKLLEWQKHVNKSELNNKSAIYCLAYVCTHHWSEGAGNMMSLLTLCQRQQITPLQYDWVVLNVHAKSNKWDLVESLFTKKDWLGRTTVSSHIPIETLLSRLNDLKAGSRILATCVNKVANTEDRLRLAQVYKIHSVVIETLAKQKDRSALNNYKMALSPQSEEYILADNTLRDLSIKWKN